MQLRPFSSALLFFCGVSSLAAQATPAADQQQSPVFHANAREVIVDVVVTDNKGAQVLGLHQADFRVLEDGKPQTIGFFEEHTARALPPGAQQPLPAMPPNVYTNVPPAPENDSVNVLLLDTLNTPEQDFAYARNQVIQYLHNVVPGTRIAIVMLSDKLTFVQGFTADASALLAAVEDRKKGVKAETSPVLVSRTEEAQINSSIAMFQSSAGGASTYGIQALSEAFDSYKDFAQRNQTLMTLEALEYLARYLSSVPGRKNLIWFSSRFPVYIFPNLSERAQAQDLVVPLARVRKTADELTTARVAVYPINVRGVTTDSVMDADSRGFANTATVGAAGSMSPMTSYMNDASNRSQIMAEMRQLADDTGGKAIYNNNDLNAAAARAIADGAHYYTVTYSPANKKLDGKYRNIDIKTDSNKYKLSYRRGYNADATAVAAPSQGANPLQPLMKLGMPASTQILYGLRAVPAAAQPAANAKIAGKNDKLTGAVTRYSVDFMIRWTDVQFTTTPQGTHAGKIQAELLAYAPDGTALNWLGGTQAMNINDATFAAIQRSGIPAHLEIDVPKGKDFSLSTGVYDPSTGKAGTLEVHLPAAATQAAGPAPSSGAR